MLDRARDKFPDVPSAKVGLQEMGYSDAFDGAVCLDALELVPPEDWLLILSNLCRAIQPYRYVYFTLETTAEPDLEQAFTEGQQLGLPVVYGEAAWMLEGGYHWGPEGCYHYYPNLEQVKDWVQRAGFQRIDDTVGEGYHHFLCRSCNQLRPSAQGLNLATLPPPW